MQTKSQQSALADLSKLAVSGKQSVMIEGPLGSGKSYLGQQYANMLSITDFIAVSPKVADIREALDNCLTVTNPVMILIENLDMGVPGAAYTILKSLEEPLPNVFIVITCRNMKRVPDTIISRSAVVSVSPPTDDDIDAYGKNKDTLKFNNVCSRLVWQCVRSFSDADIVLAMSPEEINYYESLSNVCKFTESVSNCVWTISHYESGKESNVELSIRSIMKLMNNPFITMCGIECLNDLNKGRVAPHAILSKFVFNAKYCE